MNKTTKFALIFFGALLFIYTTTKAYLLTITWDEAFSYLEFVRYGIFIQENFNVMSANNHLLNTWMQIPLVNCFGSHELVLRIPSLFAHLLFLIYSAKLVSFFHTKWLIIASFLIINLNPYLLDFFSLARGYGLSFGFMMASIYYLYVFHKGFKTRTSLLSLSFSTLAVVSNFILLNYMLALYAVIFLLCIYKTKTEGKTTEKLRFWKKIALPTVLFFLTLAFVLPIGLALKEANALFFGAENGFWKGTVYSIVDRCFYELGYNYWFQRIAKLFLILILLAAGIQSFIQIKRKQFTSHSLFLISLLLVFGMCILSTVLQHLLFQTPYLMDRTALFLMVLFTIILVFFINEQSIKNPATAYIAYASALITIIHMCLSFNLSYVLEWKSDMNTKEMLLDLEKIKKIPTGKSTVSINIPLWFEPGINFYRNVHRLTWLNQVSRSKKRNRLDDYYYLSQKELAMLPPDSIEILKIYPVTQNVLARPKYRFNEVKVCLNQEMTFEKEPNQQYFIDEDTEFSKSFSHIVNDTTPFRNAVVVFEIEAMPTLKKESNLLLIIALENNQGVYLWESLNIMEYLNYAEDWKKASFSCIIPDETKAGDKLSLYLWNHHKQELLVKKMQFKWLHYQ